MPLPYTKKSLDYDSGALEPKPFPEWQGIPVGSVDYVGEYNLLKFPKETSTGRIAWITEAHVSMALTKGGGGVISGFTINSPRFHHYFLGSMLPFASRPRIADDKRHPGGITMLFYDNHADRVSLQNVDVGWPKSLGMRLRYFTILPLELSDHW